MQVQDILCLLIAEAYRQCASEMARNGNLPSNCINKLKHF